MVSKYIVYFDFDLLIKIEMIEDKIQRYINNDILIW